MTKPAAAREETNGDELLKAVLRAHRELLSRGGEPKIIARVLELVGRAAQADRVYVFQFRSDERGALLASQRHEWNAAGVSAQVNNPHLQNIPMREAGYGRWLDLFATYQPVAGHIRTFPEGEQRILDEQDIGSLVVLPIYAGALLWGFVGFDDCKTDRVWTDAEVGILLSLAISLGATLLPIYKDSADVFDRPTTNSRISAYAAIAGCLILPGADDDDTMRSGGFSQQAIEARIRTLVRTHQFLRDRTAETFVRLDDYLVWLEDHLHLTTRERGVRTTILARETHRIHVSSEGLPAIGLLVTERLSTIRERDRRAGRLSRLTVAVRREGRHATISVEGFDDGGEQVELTVATTTSGHLLERRLLSYLDGCVSGSRTDRVSTIATFPVVT